MLSDNVSVIDFSIARDTVCFALPGCVGPDIPLFTNNRISRA